MESTELADWGLRAYRAGDFPTAIKFLSELAKKTASSWDCRLYLAMSYCRVSEVGGALQELKDIAQWCPERDLRDKALLVLRELNRQAQNNAKRM